MRGKNILWLCFIAMLFSSTLVAIGMAPGKKPKVSILPARLPVASEHLGHPGDEYDMSVVIDDVVDLYAFGLTVQYAPYVSVLVGSDVNEGDFLSEGGSYATGFAKKISAFAGTIKVGATRLGIVPGATGSGVLFTFKLKVREAGSSPVDLLDVVLKDSAGNVIACDTWNSAYYGATADLIRASMPDGRVAHVGDAVVFTGRARNDGDVPLTVRIRYDAERMEDGRRIQIYSGQNYAGGGLGEPLPFDYIYLDEFNEWYYEWNNPATNALGTPDGNYIEGDANGQWASLYSWEDILVESAGKALAYAEIEGYSQYPNGATEGADIDLYAFTSVQGFAWLGSNYGDTAWNWHGVRWTTDKVTDVVPEIAGQNEDELNGMELMFYNYYGDAPDVLRVDSCRLKLFWSSIVPVIPPTYTIMPGMELELDPFTINEVTTDMIGTYTVTATLEYTLEGLVWNEGAKTRTFSFEIRP